MNESRTLLRADRLILLCALALTAAAAGFALTNQSLWIDEANSALKATQPSLASWWHLLVSERGSELQMPFYMFYLWVWDKIAGHTELALRAANIPWLFLAHYCLYRACRQTRVNSLPLLALASSNPFLWFYLNEARPYVMQYAGSCLVICGLSEAFARASSDRPPGRSTILFLSMGMIVMAGSSMLGCAWSGTALLAFVFIYLRKGQWTHLRNAAVSFIATLVAGAILGFYYLWTLHVGSGGSLAGKIGIGSILFVPYELLGFAGLGPARLQLREIGYHLPSEYLTPLFLFGGVVAIVLVAAARGLLQPAQRDKLVAGFIYGFPAGLFVWALGFAAHFRVLGRHLTPLAPLVCIALACGLTELWQRRARIFAVAMCLFWLSSALLLRFAPRHRKDDYRTVATEARATLAGGGSVWWAADRAAAIYYKVPIGEAKPAALILANPLPSDLAKLQSVDLVVLSKHDLYDANGAIAAFLATERYKEVREIPAFTVWRR